MVPISAGIDMSYTYRAQGMVEFASALLGVICFLFVIFVIKQRYKEEVHLKTILS